ncbi:hypothetical protein PAXRUDRAFT_489320, partial [Paxillus rubicundulus Ve08.2h10]
CDFGSLTRRTPTPATFFRFNPGCQGGAPPQGTSMPYQEYILHTACPGHLCRGAVIQHHLSSLPKKYNEINKELGQTGAGRTYEELVAEPRSQNIVELALKAFPWW